MIALLGAKENALRFKDGSIDGQGSNYNAACFSETT